MSDLERRVAALERAARRWRAAAALLAIVLLLAGAGAANTSDDVPDLLRARRIEVLAPDGKPVIVLRAEAQGSRLTLHGPDRNQERAIVLGVVEEAAHLMMMKNKEAPLLSARVDDAGSSLTLIDGRQPSQEPRSIRLRSAHATEDMRGGTTITLMRGLRKIGVEAALPMEESTGDASLYLGGSRGKAAKLRVNQDNGKVEFLDKSNKRIWSTP